VRLDEGTYRASSQSQEIMYDVVRRENDSWICSCFDHYYRQVRCKHIIAVQVSLELRNKVHENTVIQPITISTRVACGSSHLKRFGVRHNKCGDIQRFCCLDCAKTFSVNLGFARMKHSPQAITTAMQMYFSGESFGNTATATLHLIGTRVSHQIVYNWI